MFAVGAVATSARVLRGKDQPNGWPLSSVSPCSSACSASRSALGTLGRLWPGPATLLSHLDAWGTAAVAAVCSVLVNNLPAASLLAARTPPRPYSLLIGLNLGPEPVRYRVTGLVLVAPGGTSQRGQPSVRAASRLGIVAVPLSVAAAVGLLLLTGSP